MPGVSMYAPERPQSADVKAQGAAEERLSPGNGNARSDSQHMRALARANEVRLARAALKRAVARDERLASEIVLDCPWQAVSMTAGELLSAQRRWGQTRTRKLLAGVGLTENKPLGTMTARQRRLLATALEAKRT